MSIRSSLSRTLLVLLVPLVILCGIGLYAVVRAALIARADEALVSRAQALSGMRGFEKGLVEIDPTHETLPQYNTPESGEFFQIWVIERTSGGGESHGRVVARSGSLDGVDLGVPPSWHGGAAQNAVISGGLRVRLSASRFTVRSDQEDADEAARSNQDSPAVDTPVLVLTAQSRVDLDRTLSLFGMALAVAGGTLIVGTLAAVRFALSRGLRPIGALSTQVASLGPGDLAKRVEPRGVPDELTPIVEHTNRLLDRLGSALEREKGLAAKAAHELRTPIAEMRAVADVTLGRERTPEEYRSSLATVLVIADRMGRSANTVLRLTRVQSGIERPLLGPVTLRGALEPAWARWIIPLAGREITCEISVPEDIRVTADAAMLAVVFENLCANAAEHTPGGGVVAATVVGDEGGTVMLCLSNTRAGLEPQPGCARTLQATPQAAGQPLHAGLGLSLAGSLVEACAGVLEVHASATHFAVTLSLARASSAAAPRLVVR